MPIASRLEAHQLAHDYFHTVGDPALAVSALRTEIRRSGFTIPVPVSIERFGFGMYHVIDLNGSRIGSVILEHGTSVNTAATELEDDLHQWILTYKHGQDGGAFVSLGAAVDAANARATL